MRTIKILYFVLLLHLFSCGQKENSDKGNQMTALVDDDKKKEEIEKLERLQLLEKISNQFGASATFDTVEYKMTYQYQNILKQNNKVILAKFNIINIEKLDSLYMVSVERRKIFIDFICDENQIKKLCPEIFKSEKIETYINDKYLILKLNDIKKIKLKIDSYAEEIGEEEPTSYVELKSSNAFYCKGEFIDIYLKPKK